MAESMDADSVYIALAEFVKKLDELKEALMDREMLLVDQIEVRYSLNQRWKRFSGSAVFVGPVRISLSSGICAVVNQVNVV